MERMLSDVRSWLSAAEICMSAVPQCVEKRDKTVSDALCKPQHNHPGTASRRQGEHGFETPQNQGSVGFF